MTRIIENLDRYQIIKNIDSILYNLDKDSNGYYNMSSIKGCLLVNLKRVFENKYSYICITKGCMNFFKSQNDQNKFVDEYKSKELPMYFILVTKVGDNYRLVH